MSSRDHLNRVIRRGNKYFVRIHTTGNVSLRMIKQAMWQHFPICGITGTILCTSPSHYIIQMLVIIDNHSPDDIKAVILSAFAPHLVNNEVHNGQLTSIAMCDVRTPALWSLYCYQIHVSKNMNETDSVLVITSYGHTDTFEAIVTRPNHEDVLIMSRDPSLLHVMQPAIPIDHSSLVPLEKIKEITNIRNSMKQTLSAPTSTAPITLEDIVNSNFMT